MIWLGLGFGLGRVRARVRARAEVRVIATARAMIHGSDGSGAAQVGQRRPLDHVHLPADAVALEHGAAVVGHVLLQQHLVQGQGQGQGLG